MVLEFSMTRGQDPPKKRLQGFEGVFQSDDYISYGCVERDIAGATPSTLRNISPTCCGGCQGSQTSNSIRGSQPTGKPIRPDLSPLPPLEHLSPQPAQPLDGLAIPD